jgi:hypothetical protein
MAFQKVGSLFPQRSVFDLSHVRKFDCDMGELVPILVEDVIPGDVWSINNEVVLRFHQPLFAPLLHEVNVFVHYFFVPYRILWDNGKVRFGHDLESTADFPGSWELFLSGGKNGTVTYSLPRTDVGSHTAQRCMDFLFGVRDIGGALTGIEQPVIWPLAAYARIFNEYYRNQTFQDEVAPSSLGAETLFLRNWERDYFTSSLPWQQRGTAPALPVTGISHAVWDGALFDSGAGTETLTTTAPLVKLYGGSAGGAVAARSVFNANDVDLSSATTFDISDLRLAFQLQRWLERNARAGVRYTEMLRSHFNVAPRDERLDRPEYIGGSKSPVIFSEVLQTGESGTTPQGHLAGHGLAVNRQFCSRYRVQEFGLIMGIMSVMPRTAYQQGINRMWLKDTKYDYYWPEFAHLSERPIWSQEVYCESSAAAHNRDVFGYQGMYDEYRYRGSSVHGSLRSTLDYWHLGRQFASRPALNESFLQCIPRKDIYPAPTLPGMLVNFGNDVRVARPMPVIADPGLLDHF